MIKPGSFVNSINPKSNGTVPVAILSTSGFNAVTQADTTSFTFGKNGNEASLAFCNKKDEDVNADNFPDLVCHFSTQPTGFHSGDTLDKLKGETTNGISISGEDAIRVVR